MYRSCAYYLHYGVFKMQMKCTVTPHPPPSHTHTHAHTHTHTHTHAVHASHFSVHQLQVNGLVAQIQQGRPAYISNSNKELRKQGEHSRAAFILFSPILKKKESFVYPHIQQTMSSSFYHKVEAAIGQTFLMGMLAFGMWTVVAYLSRERNCLNYKKNVIE